MSIPGRVEAAVKGLVLWAGLGMAALAVALAGLGFLIAGFFIWVGRYEPWDAAAAITGGVLLLLTIAIALAGKTLLDRIKRRQPTLMQELGGAAGIAGSVGRLAGLIVRRDPRKAVILAMIAGAVVEYVTGGDKKRKG